MWLRDIPSLFTDVHLFILRKKMNVCKRIYSLDVCEQAMIFHIPVTAWSIPHAVDNFVSRVA